MGTPQEQLRPRVAPEDFFKSTSPDYPSMAREAATRYGVDPNIFERQMAHESINYDPDVVSGRRKSPKGAAGIAQFMPDTAARYGLRGEDLADPPRALDAAARHMRDLLDETGNDYEAALAGYNAGLGRVRDGSWSRIPETRNYTSKILGAARQGLKPKIDPDSFFANAGTPAQVTAPPASAPAQPSRRSRYSTWAPPAQAPVAATAAPTPTAQPSARSKYSTWAPPPPQFSELLAPKDRTSLPPVTLTPQSETNRAYANEQARRSKMLLPRRLYEQAADVVMGTRDDGSRMGVVEGLKRGVEPIAGAVSGVIGDIGALGAIPIEGFGKFIAEQRAKRGLPPDSSEDLAHAGDLSREMQHASDVERERNPGIVPGLVRGATDIALTVPAITAAKVPALAMGALSSGRALARGASPTEALGEGLIAAGPLFVLQGSPLGGFARQAVTRALAPDAAEGLASEASVATRLTRLQKLQALASDASTTDGERAVASARARVVADSLKESSQVEIDRAVEALGQHLRANVAGLTAQGAVNAAQFIGTSAALELGIKGRKMTAPEIFQQGLLLLALEGAPAIGAAGEVKGKLSEFRQAEAGRRALEYDRAGESTAPPVGPARQLTEAGAGGPISAPETPVGPLAPQPVESASARGGPDLASESRIGPSSIVHTPLMESVDPNLVRAEVQNELAGRSRVVPGAVEPPARPADAVAPPSAERPVAGTPQIAGRAAPLGSPEPLPAQLEALRAGDRRAVVVPAGEELPETQGSLTAPGSGLAVTKLPDGSRVIHYSGSTTANDPRVVSKREVKALAAAGRLHELEGPAATVSQQQAEQPAQPVAEAAEKGKGALPRAALDDLESVGFYRNQGYTEIADDTLARLRAQYGNRPEFDRAFPAKPPESPKVEAAKPTAAEPERKFSSTQVNLPAPVAKRVTGLAAKIPDSALAADGRETEPHITVNYGLHTGDAEKVRKVLAGEGPITVTLGRTSIFPAKEAAAQRGGDQYDVVKIDVDSPDLHRLNKKIADALPHTDTHPEYKPHVTLAYVKPGEGEKYAGDASLEGQTVSLNSVAFSGKDGSVVEIPLGGKANASTEQIHPETGPGGVAYSGGLRGEGDAEGRGRADRLRHDAETKAAVEPASAGQNAAAKAAPANVGSRDLARGTRTLIDSIKARLASGEGVKDNPTLTKLADEAFGGTRAKGTYGPKDSADALEVAVNQHLAGSADRLMAGKPKQSLHEIRKVMKLLPRQVDRTTEQIELQQFSTPPTEAFVAAKALAPTSDDLVVEPSAGTGSLAMWPRAVGAQVRTNEIDPRRRALLEAQGYSTTHVDAQFLDDLLPAEIQPTAILMNPPFSSTGGRVTKHDSKYGAEHVEDALKRLAPNGRLVAIVSEGMAMDREKMGGWWRRILADYNVRANISVPGEEYGKYGTTYGNQIIVIDKTGPTPGENLSARLSNVIQSAPKDLEGVLDALKPVIADRPAIKPVAARPATVERDSRHGDRRPGQPKASTKTDRGDVVRGTGERPGPTPDEARPTGPAEGAPPVPRGESGPGPVEAAQSEAERAIRPGNADVRAVAPPREEGETFVAYRPAKFKGGLPHPGNIVESASMAAVDPPEITYKPKLDPDVLTEGRLSDLQYEAVAYAGQRHEQRLPNGNRAGFFVGDGTGVGKGRILAGVALDNWNQGRRRILWLSVNNDLVPSTDRDLKALGGAVPLAEISAFSASGDIEFKDGLLFSSYSTLISRSKGGRERLDQIRDWLGTDGVIMFDEAHLAKNATASGQKESSQRGQKVVALQEGDKTNADYRIVYASATGATDPENMGYMVRLGLWGPGTSFPGGFQEFQNAIDTGGVGAMEMVSRDLKAMGMYTARTLSYKGVDYREVEHKLTPSQRELYDTAARGWQVVLQNFDKAIQVTNADSRARTQAMKRFWNDEQRFFRQFLTALKVPAAIEQIEAALKDGQSVVLGLYGTGEARTKDQVTNAMAAGRDLDDLDFSPKQILTHLVDNALPTARYTEATDPQTKKIIKVPVLDADGNPVESAQAKRMKAELLDQLESLSLPDNPLDQIVNYFGVDKVAEITGRKKRLVRGADGKTRYVKRVEGVSMEKASQHEMQAFQDGRKRIAIISASASTGISLHADNTGKNTQRRAHITLETGWSADVQMQTFGRTHRTNQASAPEYVLLSTDVGGERRFLSTIAKRLASLGALTKGERKATGVGGSEKEGLEKYDFLNQYGTAAVRRMIQQPRKTVGDETAMKLFEKIGLVKEDRSGTKQIVEPTVERLLNRVLALELDQQNAMFAWFGDEFARAVQNAKDSGTFDEGVSDVKGESIRLMSDPAVVGTDKTTGAETLHYQLEVDEKTHPVTFADAQRIAKEHEGGAFYRQVRSGNLIVASKAGTRTDEASGRVTQRWHVTRPSGAMQSIIDQDELISKYQPVHANDAKVEWAEAYKTDPGIRTRSVHIVGGAILPVWERLQSRDSHGLKVVRLITDEGQRIVGVQIPSKAVGAVLKAIGVERSFKGPDAIFAGVLEDNETVELVGGMRLEQTYFRGDTAIELKGADAYKEAELKQMGLIHEIVSYRDRFFVPTDETKGVEVLRKLFDRYPAMSATGDDEAATGSARGSAREKLRGTKAEERKAGEAGFVTITEGRGGQPPARAGYGGFEDPEMEARWKAAKGIRPEYAWQKAKEAMAHLKRLATRDLEHLPRTSQHAELNFALHRLAQGKGIASDESVRILQGLTAGLNKEKYDLFTRRIILYDLMEEVERQAAGRGEEADIRLPFGFTPETVMSEFRRLSAALKDHPDVERAVEQRRAVTKEVTSEYLKAAKQAIGFEPKLTRDYYYRHQVLAHAEAARVKGTGPKIKAPTGRGFLKQRHGSELDINTDYLQAEHSVLAQMLFDTQVFKLIHLVDENYNTSEALKREAKRANDEAIQTIIDAEGSLNKPVRKVKRQSLSQFVRERGGIREDSDLAGERRRLSRKETGTTGLTSAGRDRGLSPDRMREAAVEAGSFMEDAPEAQNAGNFLFAVEADATGGRKIYSMQDDAPDLEGPMFLTVGEQMKQFKSKIGRGFAELRGLAAEGELWTGDNNEWESAARRLTGHRNFDEDLSERNSLFKYIAALAANEEAVGNLQARIILKAISNRRAFIKQTLGKDFKEWHALVPDNVTLWQPREGNIFFRSYTLPEKLIDAALDQRYEQMGFEADDLRRAMVMGGRRREFAIPDEVALTLDDFMKPRDSNPLDRGVRALVRGWKVWQLISPHRLFKYNARNLSGDGEAAAVGNPRTFLKVGKSTHDLYEYLGRKSAPSAELQEWLGRGGLYNLFQVAEDVGSVNGLKVFRGLEVDKEGNLQNLNLWKRYWQAARIATDFREAILRYAAFLDYREQTTSNRAGKPGNYGASIPEEVDAMRDPSDKAYKLSNDLLGAYDEVTVMGQWLREHLFPFWSWQEVNAKRYYRLFKNSIYEGRNASDAGRRFAGKAARLSPLIAFRIGKFLLKATAMWAMLSAYNNLVWPDEEKDLDEKTRSRLHIILGRRADGSVIYFDRLGMLGDFLSWFGLDEAPHYVGDFLNNKRTAKEIAVEMAKAPANKFWQGTGLPKTAAEFAMGRNTYPDVFRSRNIRDRWQYLFQSFALGDEYAALTSKPSRGAGRAFRGLFVYEVDPAESAYNQVMSLKSDFNRKRGKAADVSVGNDKSNAAYYLKLALRYGDVEAAKQQLAEYKALGGTAQGLQASIKSLAPLSGLNETDKAEFLKSLTPDEREKLAKAQVFFETALDRSEEVGPADLLERPIAKEIREPVDKELHRLGVGFPFPQNEVTIGGAAQQMPKAKFDEFQQRVAETFYAQLGDMISKPIYQRMNDEDRRVAIEDFKQAWVGNERRRLHGQLVTEGTGASPRERIEAQREGIETRMKERELGNKEMFLQRRQIERRLKPRSEIQIPQ